MDDKDLENKIDELTLKIDALIDRQKKEIQTVFDAEQCLDHLFWQAIHQLRGGTNVALDDSKRQFFRRMDPATGDLRLLQRAIAILLGEMDTICRQNDITYFCAAGTLLGANRHAGFIPWDDDADVFMLREDSEKFAECLKGNKKFKVTSFSDNKMNFIRIFRFTYNDERLGKWQVFVDIFLLDWAPDTSDKTWEKYLQVRKLLNAEYRDLRKKKKGPDLIRDFLEEKYKKVWRKKVNPTNSKNALCWGWDNFTHGSKYINEYDFVFPLSEVDFEGHRLFAPRFPEKYSRWRYGLWLEIPRSAGMRQHTAIDAKLINVIKEKLEEYGQ